MNLDEIRQKLCFLLVKIRMVDYGGNIVEHHRSLEVLCRNLSLITTPADVKKEECADLLKQCIDLFNSKSEVKREFVFTVWFSNYVLFFQLSYKDSSY